MPGARLLPHLHPAHPAMMLGFLSWAGLQDEVQMYGALSNNLASKEEKVAHQPKTQL